MQLGEFQLLLPLIRLPAAFLPPRFEEALIHAHSFLVHLQTLPLLLHLLRRHLPILILKSTLKGGRLERISFKERS